MAICKQRVEQSFELAIADLHKPENLWRYSLLFPWRGTTGRTMACARWFTLAWNPYPTRSCHYVAVEMLKGGLDSLASLGTVFVVAWLKCGAPSTNHQMNCGGDDRSLDGYDWLLGLALLPIMLFLRYLIAKKDILPNVQYACTFYLDRSTKGIFDTLHPETSAMGLLSSTQVGGREETRLLRPTKKMVHCLAYYVYALINICRKFIFAYGFGVCAWIVRAAVSRDEHIQWRGLSHLAWSHQLLSIIGSLATALLFVRIDDLGKVFLNLLSFIEGLEKRAQDGAATSLRIVAAGADDPERGIAAPGSPGSTPLSP